MPTTLSQTAICNMALGRVGSNTIPSISAQDNLQAAACRDNWELAVAETGRAHTWNCLMHPAVLVASPQTPIGPAVPAVSSTPWAPATAYAANAYVTYGGALYQALIANTSTASFTNDLTSGFWFQTDVFDSDPFDPNQLASQYPSGWAYKYALPQDCLLVYTLNDNPQTGPEEEYEVIGTDLYTNCNRAVIKYVRYLTDTTRFDAMFTGCLVLMLASKIATVLRQDDAVIAEKMTGLFTDALHKARTKDAGERKPRRFNPVANSRFVGSRYFSTNS